MFISRKVLDKTGAFDERFFMYAEDIDLSYRIEQKGFTNYYIADTTILHFKGESTHKDARYVKLFYGAMIQFRRKHFSGVFSRVLNGLLAIAIRIRASFSSSPPAASSGYDIILSESDSSFKEIIKLLQYPHGKRTLIHASASGSAVGSPSAEGRGITIVM